MNTRTEKNKQYVTDTIRKIKARRAQSTHARNTMHEDDHPESTFINDTSLEAAKAVVAKFNLAHPKPAPDTDKTFQDKKLSSSETNADCKTFEDHVQANLKNGMNRTKAIRTAVYDHPNLHEDYLLRLKGENKGGVKKLLPSQTNPE